MESGESVMENEFILIKPPLSELIGDIYPKSMQTKRKRKNDNA